MKELTLGEQTFKDIIESNCLYIDKIVDTYKYRIEEDMYSRLFNERN